MAFKIEGMNDEYVFYPYTGILNNNKVFYNIAEEGDSIVKERYSPLLSLIKGGKIYVYNFREFK